MATSTRNNHIISKSQLRLHQLHSDDADTAHPRTKGLELFSNDGAIDRHKLNWMLLFIFILIGIVIFMSIAYRDPSNVIVYDTIVNLTNQNENREINVSSVCQQDNHLCKMVKNPICKYIMRYPIILQYHHKTGFALTKQITNDLQTFCQHSYFSQTPMIQRVNPKHAENIYDNQQMLNISILFHFMRAPVKTILSGFYYHTHYYTFVHSLFDNIKFR